MAVKPLGGDFGRLVLISVVMLLSLMSLISTCSSRSINNAQESEVFAEVVGAAECLDCDEMNIKHEHAFKGLQIAIKCKTMNKLQEEPYYEIKATSELNPKGEFTVKLPVNLIGHLDDLTTQCFAQLHDASNTPCPHQTPSNIILLQSKLNSNKLITYSTSTSKLPFSSSTCTSAFLLHKFFHHHIYKKPNPLPSPSPTPVYKKPTYVPKYPPVYKKPMPPTPKFHPHPKFQLPPSHGWPPLPPFSSHHPNHPYYPPSKDMVLPSP